MSCSGIFQGQTFDCDDPLLVGVNQRLLVANKADIASVTFAAAANGERIISAITMDSGKYFWAFNGVNESLAPNYELVRGNVSNGFRHVIDFSVLEVDSAAKSNIQRMAWTRSCAIVYQEESTSLGDGAFALYGWDVGLDLLTATRAPGDVDTGGAHVLQLATPEAGSNENSMPISIWSTDYDTTLGIVNGLLSS